MFGYTRYGGMLFGVKPVIPPTYYYPAVSIDYWDIVFISQV